MRVLLIDNYDSFTWNLYQQISMLGAECIVKKNDEMSLKKIEMMKPDRIVLSPGPGNPKKSGVCLEILRYYNTPHYPLPTLLGVCLGHQCIAHVFGNPKDVVRAPKVMHGKTSKVFHGGKGIFRGIPSPFEVARYHSLVIKQIPTDFELTAWTGSRQKPEIIMGIQHKKLPIFGVQFHPESFMTKHGEKLMKNFLFWQW